jgi:hypothetical protein
MLLAQASAETRLAALLGRANLVARLRHLAVRPQPVMFAAITLRDYIVAAVFGLAGSFATH